MTDAAKPAPPARAKPRPESDDDDEPKASPQQKPGVLPTGLSRAIVIAAVLATLTFVTTSLLSNRYELVAATKSDNAIVYRLDRLTGRVSFCSASQCNVLPNRAAEP